MRALTIFAFLLLGVWSAAGSAQYATDQAVRECLDKSTQILGSYLQNVNLATQTGLCQKNPLDMSQVAQAYVDLQGQFDIVTVSSLSALKGKIILTCAVDKVKAGTARDLHMATYECETQPAADADAQQAEDNRVPAWPPPQQ